MMTKVRRTDAFYAEVAAAYGDAVARGLWPRKVLADQHRAADATVAAWIVEARKRGHLPPTTPGKMNPSRPIALPDTYPFRSREVALVEIHEGLAEVVFAARPSGSTRVLTLTTDAAIELHRQLGEKLEAAMLTRKVAA